MLGGGPDPGIFHISKKKKVVFKMHFKPFQAILDHVFFIKYFFCGKFTNQYKNILW